MRQDYSTRNRVKGNSEIVPPSVLEETHKGRRDPLNVTRKARGLIENDDPVALEIFHMGRRHGLEIQESRSQIAMRAFIEGFDPNFHGEVSYEWMRLANACRVWFDPVIHQPVQPRALHALQPGEVAA